MGAIPDVGDNHFGYVGFRDTNGKLRDNGAMDVVVENWNNTKTGQYYSKDNNSQNEKLKWISNSFLDLIRIIFVNIII